MSAYQIISCVQGKQSDYLAVKEFAYQMAFKWYQCHPSEVPQYIFMKNVGTQIVSTVGVTQHKLPLRNLYQMEARNLPKHWQWDNVIQLSWFFSNRKGYFLPLLLAALQCNYDIGKTYAILQMKEKIYDLLSGKGLQLTRIKHATLLSDHIHSEDQGYYLDTNPIHVYYLNLKENIHSITDYLNNKHITTLHHSYAKNIYTGDLHL